MEIASAGSTRLGINHQNMRSMTVIVSWLYLPTSPVGEVSPLESELRLSFYLTGVGS